MGTWLGKVEPEFMAYVDFPVTNVDDTRVGDVYVLGYRQSINDAVEASRKLAHFALLIDLAGASTDEFVNGLEIHFIIDRDTHKPSLSTFRKRRPKGDLLFWRYLGKIANEHHPGNPSAWYKGLNSAIIDWFQEFTATNGTTWNHRCNCQQFTRFLAVNKYVVSYIPLTFQIYPFLANKCPCSW